MALVTRCLLWKGSSEGRWAGDRESERERDTVYLGKYVSMIVLQVRLSQLGQNN